MFQCTRSLSGSIHVTSEEECYCTKIPETFYVLQLKYWHMKYLNIVVSYTAPVIIIKINPTGVVINTIVIFMLILTHHCYSAPPPHCCVLLHHSFVNFIPDLSFVLGQSFTNPQTCIPTMHLGTLQSHCFSTTVSNNYIHSFTTIHY
jgi:hypothetical protein